MALSDYKYVLARVTPTHATILYCSVVYLQYRDDLAVRHAHHSLDLTYCTLSDCTCTAELAVRSLPGTL